MLTMLGTVQMSEVRATCVSTLPIRSFRRPAPGGGVLRSLSATAVPTAHRDPRFVVPGVLR
ncbi:hypothetical protein GCM10027425_02060 [Alteromonas gracilis]